MTPLDLQRDAAEVALAPSQHPVRSRARPVPLINRPPVLAIVSPTYNEVENVQPFLEKLKAALGPERYEVIFVDDNSPDGTAARIRQMASGDTTVRCIQRLGRRGLSSACIEGVLSTNAPYVAIMDADMQHDERLLPAMLKAAQTGAYDVVVASRYLEGGGVGAWSRTRLRISQLASAMGRLLLNADLTDPMSGFFLVRRGFFEQAAPRLSNEGFKILFDLFISSPQAPRYLELPYAFGARQNGQSKLDSKVALDYLQLVVSKLSFGLIPPRFVFFAAVGVTGLMLHMGVLSVVDQLMGQSFFAAQICALGAATLCNYTLNNAITYRDRRRTGVRFFTGLLSFALICSIGAVGNVGIAEVLFDRHSTWWIAGAAGALVGAVWNYAMASTLTWKTA